jgi:hypothetical protein
MTCRQRTAQAQFTCENGGTNDTRELSCIVSGVCGVGAANTEEVKHGSLRLENRTTSNGAYFNRRHGNRNL